eukprot:gene11264-21455_t
MTVSVTRWILAGFVLVSVCKDVFCAQSTSVLNECKYKVEPIGCFADDLRNRALPEQIINERDPYSNVYNGRLIEWKTYDTYLQGFICRCAEKAFAKGYKMIGIQFYGECWSGPSSHKDYKKHEKSSQCLTPVGEVCDNTLPVCTGKDSTNYVYRIAPTECDIPYAPVGCFKDNNVDPRPLPEYVMNERDYSTSNWNGKLIDWKNWDTYSPQFICRCAKAVKEKGFTYFGAQFFGECWSGENSKISIEKDGTSEKCIAEKFEPCSYNSYHCVGQDHTNRVYKLIEGIVITQ